MLLTNWKYSIDNDNRKIIKIWQRTCLQRKFENCKEKFQMLIRRRRNVRLLIISVIKICIIYHLTIEFYRKVYSEQQFHKAFQEYLIIEFFPKVWNALLHLTFLAANTIFTIITSIHRIYFKRFLLNVLLNDRSTDRSRLITWKLRSKPYYDSVLHYAMVWDYLWFQLSLNIMKQIYFRKLISNSLQLIMHWSLGNYKEFVSQNLSVM